MGAFLILVGAARGFYGAMMPEDKQVDTGFGTHVDSTGFVLRGVLVFVMGVFVLILGILAQVPQ